MIAPPIEKRMLQLAVALSCLVPLAMGALSVLRGVAVLEGAPIPVAVDLDSHFRYLSGIFLAVGIAFATCVPAIERKGPRLRLLGALIVAGGLARLLSLAQEGVPGHGHQFGLAMELGVVPLLLLWQRRVARRCAQ